MGRAVKRARGGGVWAGSRPQGKVDNTQRPRGLARMMGSGYF